MILTIIGPTAAAADDDTVLARVDDIVITRQEFEREVYTAARQTYYHGRPPRGEEFIEFRKSVAENMMRSVSRYFDDHYGAYHLSGPLSHPEEP